MAITNAQGNLGCTSKINGFPASAENKFSQEERFDLGDVKGSNPHCGMFSVPFNP